MLEFKIVHPKGYKYLQRKKDKKITSAILPDLPNKTCRKYSVSYSGNEITALETYFDRHCSNAASTFQSLKNDTYGVVKNYKSKRNMYNIVNFIDKEGNYSFGSYRFGNDTRLSENIHYFTCLTPDRKFLKGFAGKIEKLLYTVGNNPKTGYERKGLRYISALMLKLIRL